MRVIAELNSNQIRVSLKDVLHPPHFLPDFTTLLILPPFLTLVLLLPLHHLHLRVDKVIPHLHSIPNIIECHIHCIQWQENPQHVEEYQVQPFEHKVTRVQILISR